MPLTEGLTTYPQDANGRYGIGGLTGGLLYFFRMTAAFLLQVAFPAAPNFATNQVSIPTTAGGTQIVAARASRRLVWILNTGTAIVYVGANGLTSATGFALYPQVAFPFVGNVALYGLAASGAQTIHYFDVYD